MASRQTSVLTSAGDDIIEVREATPDDYEEICAINRNIYGGLDYIPDVFHSCIKDPAVNFYVLVKNGNIVGFKGLMIAPSKNHFISMALRVAPSEQGKGLLGVLQKNAKELFLQTNPNMNKMMTVGLATRGLQSFLDKNEKAKVLLRRNTHVHLLHSATDVFSHFLANHGIQFSTEFKTTPLPAMEMHQRLTQAVINKFMPEKIFMYSRLWTPEITEENMGHPNSPSLA